jgi:hypothetical protein
LVKSQADVGNRKTCVEGQVERVPIGLSTLAPGVAIYNGGNLNATGNGTIGLHPRNRSTCNVRFFDRSGRKAAMSRKLYRPEEIIAKLRQAEVLLGEGKTLLEVVKVLGIHEVTYYRWRKEYGGLKVSQARRLKELERENTRLRRAVSDLTLDKLILQEAARGNF